MTAGTEHALSALQLDVRRSGEFILGPLDLTLQAGKITAICGPNGAGKSTLLASLAGLSRASTGTVMLGEEPIGAFSPRRRARSIGFLPQDGEIAWDVAVRNLVELGRIPHRDKRSAPVDGALKALDLVGLSDRPVSQLSGGERARALLARVLAGEPRWILADEPLAALDLAHQLALMHTFRENARVGRGIVLVLHDLSIAMNYADRVVVLDGGALLADDKPDVALSSAVLERVWSVQAEWLGKPGTRTLAVRSLI